MKKVMDWLLKHKVWLILMQFAVGTLIPAFGLYLVYINLNAIYPHSGGVVVGVLLLLYGYLATQPRAAQG